MKQCQKYLVIQDYIISIYMYLPKITISPLIYRGVRPLGSCLVFSLRQLFGEFGRPVSIGW